MKLLKKAAVLIAVLITVVWSISIVLAEDASTAVLTQNGIETQLMTDKNDYKNGETVEVSVRIRNTNLSDVKNVKSVLILPDQFSSKKDTIIEKAVLRAGESIGDSYQVAKATNPKTGSVFSFFFNLLMVLSSIFLLMTLLKSKYIRKKSLSITLCFALLLPLLGQTGVQASDVFGKSYSVGKAFKMGQANYEVKANVTYGELLTNGPELSSVSPFTGSFGSKLVLSGAGFTSSTTVVFKSDALGEIGVTPSIDESGNLCVVSPTIYVETVKIYAVTDGKYSNPLDFHVVALPIPNGHEFEAFSDAFDSVFDEFGNELENVYQTGDTSQSLQEQQQMISELQTAMNEDIAYFNTLLTEEDRVFVNQLFASEALLGATERLEQAAEVLSHSTTSEALDNIEKTKDMLDELIDVLKEIKEIVNTIKIAAVAATVALAVISVFTGGAAAEAAVQAGKIANNCRKIVNNLLNPAIIGLSAIRALLELAPTIAVGDSLTTADYEGDISINQYFGSLEASVRNPIKSLVSYSSTFGTLPDSAEQGETILENLDQLIDEFAGTDRNSTEEQITASFNDKFNKFIFDETLETLSENGVPAQNASLLPENPLTLSLQEYIKTYFPETYLACINKDKERHEFEAKNGLVFKSLFGTSVMLKEAVEPDNYTAAGDTRSAADYSFNWSFESILFADHYWSFLEDSETSTAKE